MAFAQRPVEGGIITTLDELEMIREERVIVNFKAPARHSNAMTEKYHEKLRQDSRLPGRH